VTITAIDSSAILRLCLREGQLAYILAAMRTAPAVSVLAAVEVPCAIAARYHRGAIGIAARDDLLRAGEETLAATVQIAFTGEVQREAVRIGQQYLVRALDAIHLATAVVLSQRGGDRGDLVRFCTADLRQANAAIALFGVTNVDVVPPLGESR
jgi:predicted nucleic acid-binding protein